MHGMLMEQFSPEWQEFLHNGTVHSFSQWIEVKNRELFIWHVCSIDDDLSAELDTIFSEKQIWHCSHKDCDFQVTDIQRKAMSFAEYMKPFFLSDKAPNWISMVFQTPCTHKVQKRYAIFPSVDLIANSLRSRICTTFPDFALAEDEVMDQVLMNTRISRYHLNSSVYHLEGASVTGYQGSLEIHFDGPDALRRLCCVLFGMAEWTGVGIKTSLGMGGCTVGVPINIGNK